jgi:hypothetical protein
VNAPHDDHTCSDQSGNAEGRNPHRAMRPLWFCRACGTPWPCAPLRLTLLDDYAENRQALHIYLAAMFHEAIRDLYRLNPYDAPTPRALFERFLGWARI